MRPREKKWLPQGSWSSDKNLILDFCCKAEAGPTKKKFEIRMVQFRNKGQLNEMIPGIHQSDTNTMVLHCFFVILDSCSSSLLYFYFESSTTSNGFN